MKQNRQPSHREQTHITKQATPYRKIVIEKAQNRSSVNNLYQKDFGHITNGQEDGNYPAFRSLILVGSLVQGAQQPYLEKPAQELDMATTECAKKRDIKKKKKTEKRYVQGREPDERTPTAIGSSSTSRGIGCYSSLHKLF